MEPTDRRFTIDPIVRVLAALTAIMVLGIVTALGVQGRLSDRSDSPSPVIAEPMAPVSTELTFDDLDHPLSIDCRAGVDGTSDTNLFLVVAESRAAEPIDYTIRVRLLPFDGPAVDGEATARGLQPNQQVALGIAIVDQPSVAADVGTYEACRVTLVESPRRVLRAD